MKLQQTEKRVKIAEACGWVFKPDEFGWSFAKLDKKGPWWKYSDGEEPFPDYFNDLNAMHEAWKSLNVANKTRFIQILADQLLDYQCMDFSLNPFMCAELANATASQRAEAFGRALNLW